MNKKTHALLSVALIVFCASLHAAEKIMYKWTDSNGEIHYTERAPKGIEYTRIKTYVDSSSTGPVKTNSTSSQDEKLKMGIVHTTLGETKTVLWQSKI